VQNLQRFQWTEREVISKLETKLHHAFEQVIGFATRNRIPHRMAAQSIAIKMVAAAKTARGLFP
jgi:glutamate dehydrogenase (NAD(P)+)